MQKIAYLLFLLLLLGQGVSHCLAQSRLPALRVVERGVNSNLRAVSSRDGKSIWVSGSNGLYARSKDGGQSWVWQSPDGFDNRDFRDVQDLGADAAALLCIDTPAKILRTQDGGKHWKTVYSNNQPGMFLDAMDFSDTKNGIVVGDPVDGKVFMAATRDGAKSWQPFIPEFKGQISKGEAFFAASGTNIHVQKKNKFILISGGAQSRLWTSGQSPALLPFRQAVPTAGPNGMDVKGNIIAIVGGDFTKPDEGDSSYAISYDGGQHWQPQHQLPGYGSSIAIISDSLLVACGLEGVWLTKNGGKDWSTIDKRPFNTMLYLPRSHKLILAGPHGMIAILEDL